MVDLCLVQVRCSIALCWKNVPFYWPMVERFNRVKFNKLWLLKNVPINYIVIGNDLRK